MFGRPDCGNGTEEAGHRASDTIRHSSGESSTIFPYFTFIYFCQFFQTHCVLLEMLEKQGELVEENAKTETGKSQEKGEGKGEKF
jgi:hypothetical protein